MSVRLQNRYPSAVRDAESHGCRGGSTEGGLGKGILEIVFI